MNLLQRVLVLFGIVLAAGRAEPWIDRVGRTIEGELSRMYGPYAAFSHDRRVQLVPVREFEGASLDRLSVSAEQLTAAPRWAESKSAVADALRDRLQRWDGAKWVEFAPGDRPEPEVYLVYFSAHWCGPCRRFTPELVEAYHQLKADARIADKFELVFISNDRNAKEQQTYASEFNMPWPVVAYRRLGRARAVERWAGNGIPCLVALTPEGDLLFHSYAGTQYLGPGDALARVRVLLAQYHDQNPEVRRGLHPLAARQHVRAAADQTRSAQPYVVGTGLDPKLYQRKGIKALQATLRVQPDGTVGEVQTEPELSPLDASAFRRVALDWLFLPAVQDGTAVPVVVRLPLKFE